MALSGALWRRQRASCVGSASSSASSGPVVALFLRVVEAIYKKKFNSLLFAANYDAHDAKWLCQEAFGGARERAVLGLRQVLRP